MNELAHPRFTNYTIIAEYSLPTVSRANSRLYRQVRSLEVLIIQHKVALAKLPAHVLVQYTYSYKKCACITMRALVQSIVCRC